MSSELEAAGAAITAGLAGGAIERPGKTPVGKHANTTGACLNCETKLEGAFCHACGQPAHISRTLGGLMHEFLHAFLNFDTKAWRTLPRLIGRPGTFTYNYIHGHRARYVSPLATFLFAVFLMFFVFSVVVPPDILQGTVGDDGAVVSSTDDPTPAQAQADLDAAKARHAEAQKTLAEAEVAAEKVRNDGEPGAGGRATGVIAGPRANARVAERAVERAADRLERAKERAVEKEKTLAEASVELGKAKTELEAVAPSAGVVVDAAKGAVDAEAARSAADAPAPPAPANVGETVKDGAVISGTSYNVNDKRSWQDQLREAVLSGDIKINSGNVPLNGKVRAALLNPDLALYKLQETASKFSFLLVPITLPFIALLFLWKRGVTFFDHVVFSLYSLSFMSLLFIVLALIGMAGEWTIPIVASIGTLVPPAHMFFHMGGTYKLGWWSALWRTSVLLFFIMFAIVIFALSILALGILS